ncbi:hypothetical protein [Dactylosporangium sp. NPDC006015]|uniref:hypothetical protein n=1 Tax=Dactylosporangium sp. NPDC006015 TaxID=3154576 RepID=UPI0033BE202E
MALVLIALLLAGCSDAIEQPGATPWTPPATQAPGAPWPDRVTADAGGVLAAPGFNAHIDATAPAWAEAADSTVAELLNLNRGFDGPVAIYLHRDKTDDDPVLTVTLTKLGDDSIQAMRYRVVLHRETDGRFRFVSGERTQRCQSGRGHQTFEAARCS